MAWTLTAIADYVNKEAAHRKKTLADKNYVDNGGSMD